jgi:formate hydrogenlyase subunit 3/multisubunit Na+/H+ antiporter MnhD subunit
VNAMLVAAWFVPLLVAALLPLLRPATAARLASAAPLPALALAVFGTPGASFELPWLLFGVQVGLDDTGRVFLLLTALLWLLAGTSSAAYLRDDPALRRYLGFFLVAQAGNVGVVLAQDIASFYMNFAAMTFSAFGLVVHDGSRQALRAGRVYIAMAVLGESMILVALVMLAAHSDSAEIASAVIATASDPLGGTIAALLVAGFGVKVGVPLLHMWLPLAHPVAPTPASAVLSGSIIKAGLVGWLRFLPLGQAAFDWAPALVAAGVVAMFGAAIVGIAQRDSKTALAYSSISQMGYATVAVGAGLAAPQVWPVLLPVVVFHALHHALAKGALFLGIGIVRTAALPRGLWLAGLLLPAAALAGAPFTSGVLAKEALAGSLGAVELAWIDTLVSLLPFAALATTLLMARTVALAWREHGTVAAHSGLVLPWAAALVAVAAVAWLAPAVVALEVPPAWKGIATLIGAWPLVGGAAIALAALRYSRVGVVPIAAGDVLVPLERLIAPVLVAALRLGRRLDAGLGAAMPDAPLAKAEAAEARLQTWLVAGGALFALAALLVLALAIR